MKSILSTQAAHSSRMRFANNSDPSARTVECLCLDFDLHVLTERGQQSHQTLTGEVCKASIEEGGNLGLVNAHECCGHDLSEPSALDDLPNMARKLRLGQLFLG